MTLNITYFTYIYIALGLLLIFLSKHIKYKLLFNTLCLLLLFVFNFFTTNFINDYKEKNSNFSYNPTYKDYSNLLSYQKVIVRIGIENHIFLLNDIYLGKENFSGVNNAKQSSVEKMFFFTINPMSEKQQLNDYNYPLDFYYQLCLFYKNNSCLDYKFDNYHSTEDLNTKRDIALTNSTLPFYRRKIIIPISKQDLIVQNYTYLKWFIKDIKDNSNQCDLLFLGAQNNWKDYSDSLLKLLKNDKDNLCFNSVLYIIKLNRVEEPLIDNVKKNMKNTLINFLNNYDSEKIDYDLLFEKSELTIQQLKNNKSSDYYELISFLTDKNNNSLPIDKKIMIQLTYLLSSEHKAETESLLTKDKKEKLIETIRKIHVNEEKYYLYHQKIMLLDFLINNNTEFFRM